MQKCKVIKIEVKMQTFYMNKVLKPHKPMDGVLMPLSRLNGMQSIV